MQLEMLESEVPEHLRSFFEPTGAVKNKNLTGIPWRVALALQDDGWWLRSDIIFHKLNVLPESVKDRPTRCHEYVFLLTKSERYFYDADAIKEPHSYNRWTNTRDVDCSVLEGAYDGRAGATSLLRKGNVNFHPEGGRNKRTVWTLATESYSGAHFATWPRALVEPMVKAGSSEKGCCPTCGSSWVRVTEKTEGRVDRPNHSYDPDRPDGMILRGGRLIPGETITVEWQPSCQCPEHDPVRCTILDPFSGSATTGEVAMRLGRDYIGLDLQPEYLSLAKERLQGSSENPAKPTESDPIFELFGEE